MKKQQGIPKDFDFASFSKEAVDRLRQGEDLNGKDGILTPLIKQILESPTRRMEVFNAAIEYFVRR